MILTIHNNKNEDNMTTKLSEQSARAKMMQEKEFISSTIGMRAYHPDMTQSRNVRVEFYKVPAGVLLVPVSALNLETIKAVRQVIISCEEFRERKYDFYDDTVEFFWAIKKLEFEFEDEEIEQENDIDYNCILESLLCMNQKD